MVEDMNKKKLNFLIEEGEGYNLELKENFSNSIAKEICAFTNANGGKILLGIADDKKIEGIKITNRLKSQIYDLTRNFDPKLDISLEEIDNVLIINVPEGRNKPYSVNGKFFVRYGTNSQQLTRNEIKEFFQKEGLVLWDEKPNYDFDLKKDFNGNKFRTFLKKSKISQITGKKEILENLYLIKQGYIKNAGVLLFCHKITKFFLNATVTCVLYQGKTKYKILDRKEFTADLYSNFQSAFLYLRSHLNTEFIIKGGPREERLELPEDALREALLNSISHRDYFSNAGILVEIFSDRVEITNPGGLVNGITKKDLGKKSLSRNNLLFGLLQRMGLVEKIGSGIKRMRHTMKDYGLILRFEIDENWFSIIFRRSKKISQKTMEKEWLEKLSKRLGGSWEKVRRKLGENQIKILVLILDNDRITIKKLSYSLKISTTAVEKNLAKLKKIGVLQRVGTAKGGYWKVLDM
jgi:ATP-dependent DNA helicase RecG